MNTNVLCFLFLIFYSVVYPQVTQNWIAKYNGSGNANDLIYAMVLDRYGHIYVTGESEGGGINASDYLTIKYTSTGDSLWVRRYNGSNFYNGNPDRAYAICADNNDYLYVTGSSYNNTGTNFDYATIKYSSAGIQQWVVRYSGTLNIGAGGYSIVADSTGNIYITGISLTSSPIDFYCITFKYNSYGVLQWAATYNPLSGIGANYGKILKLDKEGNIYVAGYSMPPGGNYDIIILKYSNSGIQLWTRRYNVTGNRNAYAYDLAVDNSGNSYIAGTTKDENGFSHFRTLKYNKDGVLLWAVPFIGQANLIDISSSIVLDTNRNIYVAGYTMISDTTTDLVVVKYNNDGVQQWVSTYNGTMKKNDRANKITVDKYGDVYVSGSCNGEKITFLNSDFLTVKFNSAGVLQWSKEFDGSAHKGDEAYCIVVDTNLNVYSAGYGIFNIVSASDYVTIKYTQPIGIKPISTNIPAKFELSQNYPNPFNPVTYIEFSIPKKSDVQLEIYNVLGIKVASLVNETLAPGTYKADWDAGNLASGIYFYKLTARDVSGSSAEDFIQVNKMVLLK